MNDHALARARHALRSSGRPISFARGETLISLGARDDDVLLIESGSVKVILSESSGAQLFAGLYGTGELIGELGVLEQQPLSATVTAQSSGSAVRIAAPAFRRLAGRNRDVLLLVNTILRERLYQADHRQLSIAARDVPTRVAGQLLRWAREFGEPAGTGLAVNGIRQEDLAKAVVASAKSVDAALRVLRTAGLVQTSRLHYELPDPALLARLLKRPGWRPGTAHRAGPLSRISGGGSEAAPADSHAMDRMPETRLLLGVDVISSAANEGHQYSALFRALDRMLGAALNDSGIDPDEILDHEPGGDGALYTLPSTRLGTVLDLTDRLDKLAAAHNRSRKPDIRLRIAVDTGAVGDEPGYFAPKISQSRLLNAPAFKQLMRHCLQECPEDSVNSGLIVSAPAFREAFGGDYTKVVRRHEFAEIAVAEKEFRDQAWVRVPGLDARTLTEFVTVADRAEPPAATEPQGSVVNQTFGPMHGVQARDIHGDIRFGDSQQ